MTGGRGTVHHEDPNVCQGVHTWDYHYWPDAPHSEWEMTATCVDCGRVEDWDEHMNRKPATIIEAFGRLQQALWLVWHQALGRHVHRLLCWLTRRQERP